MENPTVAKMPLSTRAMPLNFTNDFGVKSRASFEGLSN